MRDWKKIVVCLGLGPGIFCHFFFAGAISAQTSKEPYAEYMNFFEKVYEAMDKNYYRPVTKDAYGRFLKTFNEKIYDQLKGQKKSVNFIRWRSAAYLVDYLKDPQDSFSAFFPPKAARRDYPADPRSGPCQFVFQSRSNTEKGHQPSSC